MGWVNGMGCGYCSMGWDGDGIADGMGTLTIRYGTLSHVVMVHWEHWDGSIGDGT